MMMRLFFLLATLLCAIFAEKCAFSPDTLNHKVVRTVDLLTHVVKIKTTITLENNGKDNVRSFYYVVEQKYAKRLAFLTASSQSAGEEEKLRVERVTCDQNSASYWLINLLNPLKSGSTITVTVDTFFTHMLQAFPKEITQKDKQFMKFIGNRYFYSPYKTLSETCTISTSGAIDVYTKGNPLSTGDKKITYGPHDNVQPFSETEVSVHYENNSPFLTVTSMTRVLEISHWGNIAVEETFDLLHTGAKLKGPFSRYDYQRAQDGYSSVKSFKMMLPAAAKDVYYRDDIGNISTSNMKELMDGVELEIRPRFPLFGGWKTHYWIGYNVPSYEFLYSMGSEFLLKMRVMDHIFDEQVVDHLTLKVILPEWSHNIRFNAPYPVKRGKDESVKTYLDFVGRPILVAHKDNLVDQHIEEFELRYTFHLHMMAIEPLLVMGAIFLFCLLVIVYVRLDFSITKDEATESRLRIASKLEQIQSIQDKRTALYQSYLDAVDKLKSSKDTSGFQAQRKKLDNEQRRFNDDLKTLQGEIRSENADFAEKLNQLHSLHQQIMENVQHAIALAERLLAGKLNKAAYVENQLTNKEKRDEMIGKMEAFVMSL